MSGQGEDIKLGLAIVPERKKRIRIRKNRDVNAPKFPLNGYVIYTNERRIALSAEQPNLSQGDLLRVCSDEWKALDEATRQKYLDDATAQRATYQVEMAKYMLTPSYKEFQAKLQEKLKSEKKKPKKEDIKKSSPRNYSAEGSSIAGEDNCAEIPIFSTEFLAHNKERESELRQLRSEIIQLEQELTNLDKYSKQLADSVHTLEAQTTEHRDRNISLRRQLDHTKQILIKHFGSMPLPGTAEGPTIETIDEYMNKLYKLMQSKDLSGTHEAFLEKARNQAASITIQFGS